MGINIDAIVAALTATVQNQQNQIELIKNKLKWKIKN